MDLNQIKEYFYICEKLGIRNLILEPKNNTLFITSELKKKIQKETTIQLYFRVNLKIDALKEFKKKIRKFNNFQDILSIETLNKEIQLQAAKDSRVDVISFSDPKILKTLTRGVVSLASQNNSFLEFSLSPLTVENKSLQSKNFRNLYRAMELIKRNENNYIFSGNFNEPYDLRHPRNLISVCVSLLGIPFLEVKKAFSENPRNLIQKVQNRQDKDILESGVRLIRGED